MRLLLGAKYAPLGCMSMFLGACIWRALGAKYADVGCMYAETLGCMYVGVGCISDSG